MGENDVEHGVRFRILGSFECWDGPERVRVGGPVHERVLVTLLLEPQRVLPVFRLVEAAWDDNPPATAAHQVRKAIAELRQRIPDGRNLIVTEGPGYRALTTLEQVDLSRFTEGLRQAREATAAGQGAHAATALREALDLWRGPLLSGSGGSVLSAASAALEERRLTAVEQLLELRLAAGETSELIGELREFIEANPLRETLRGQLMLALFRSGRQAEALEEFTKVREFLVDELGIGPGDALTELHHGILRNSPELAAPAQAAGPAPFTPEGSPSTLPYDLGDFTGRQEEVSQLLGYVEKAPGTGPLIVAIDGMGGSGKTSLAVRAAHQLTDRYPDGQLHIDLRGFTPSEQPLTAGAAAEALLRMFGAPGERIPDDAESRIALWRRTMSSRRMILLLDNAVDESQIRPLLASPTQTLVLVTSRALLADLDAAHTVSLGVMPPHDSIALVEGVLGSARAHAEPEAVAQLAELCGHLPLALRIAAARLRKRPRWTVRYLVDRLRDDAHRLAELSSGERSVEVTLRLSYEGLPAETREAFRLLGQHPGAEIEVYAAGALLDKRARDAEDVLEYLLDMHLLQQHETGRYAFHDLVRSFAQNLSRVSGHPAPEAEGGDAGTDTGDEEAARAVRRLLDFALGATDAACDLLFPGRVRIRRPAHRPPAELPPLETPEQAREWLEREQDSLLAAVSLAFRWELDTHVVLLAANVAFPLDLRGRLEEFRELSDTAVTASRRLGDPVLLRLSLSNLAVACWKLGRFEEGMKVSEEAFGLAVDLADRRGEAKDTGVLGLLLSALGRYAEALPRLEQSIAIKRELGAERAEAESLTNLSNLYAEWGRFPEAVEAAARAVTLSRGIGAVDKEVEGLTDLAVARLGLGAVDEAADLLRRARKLALDVMSPADMSLLLALSAEAADRLGDSVQATAWAESALRLGDLSRAPMKEAVVSNIVGRLHARRGGYSRSLELHQQARRAASGVGYRIEEAHALAGMAHALENLGEHESARVHRSTADEAFDAMGVPVGRTS